MLLGNMKKKLTLQLFFSFSYPSPPAPLQSSLAFSGAAWGEGHTDPQDWSEWKCMRAFHLFSFLFACFFCCIRQIGICTRELVNSGWKGETKIKAGNISLKENWSELSFRSIINPRCGTNMYSVQAEAWPTTPRSVLALTELTYYLS